MLTRAHDRNASASFAQADVHALPFDASRFDVIVCHGSFPHFRDQRAALIEIRRALKPGARVLILHDLSREKINAIHRGAQSAAIHDDLLPDGDALRALLASAGFVEIRVEDAEDRYVALARAPQPDSSSDLAVRAENVVARYGNTLALKNVSLVARRGEMIGLFGANGAGKSTFLKALIGVVPLAAGSLTVLGNSVGDARYNHARPRVGYVPQKLPNGRFPVTVRDAVAMGRYGLAGLGRSLTQNDHALVSSALDQMGLRDLADRLVQNLSGGQAQRVAIARALAQEPELLLLDEPTASLDRAGQLELARQVQTLNRARGITVVIVSHNVEVAQLCQRLYLFDAGQARAIDSIAELGYA
jgi:ABC-type Mn2+/Zn2+ transport system ATPase subunit